MSTKKQDVTIVGAGVAACAVCCAGPILGFLAAIGLGTAVGAVLWGAIAVVIGAAVAMFVVMRRRQRAQACATASPTEAAVHMTATRTQQ